MNAIRLLRKRNLEALFDRNDVRVVDVLAF